jgi:hypothetical protein
VYLDLLAQEEVNCLTDTGSDDTGSSISTVLGPFDQLEEETLQPPLNFQDAPLSYGDEKMLPPKPAPRKDVQPRFRSGKKRPPPPPPPRNDRPQCPLNVQTIAVVEMDRGDLPRLVDVVPKSFLETELLQSNALLERPVIAESVENRYTGTDEELTSSTAIESRDVLACEEENLPQVALASNEENCLATAANDEEAVTTENGSVDAGVAPSWSENGESMDAMMEMRVVGDGKVVEMQENGFIGEEYKSVGMQNEDPVHVIVETAEGRPANAGSKDRALRDGPAGTESAENISARIGSNENRHEDACSSKNSFSKTESMDSLLITENKENENSSMVIDCERNKHEGKDNQEYTLRETGVKENRVVVIDSKCSSLLSNGNNGEVYILADMEENLLTRVTDGRKRPQMANIEENQSRVTDTNGSVDFGSTETNLKENGHMEIDVNENVHMEGGPKEISHVETETKESRIFQTSMKEEKHRVSKNEGSRSVWNNSEENNVLTERCILSDSQRNCDLVNNNNGRKAMQAVDFSNSALLEGSAENSPSETDRKEDVPVLTESDERSLVMQNMENSSLVIDAVDKRVERAESEDSFSVCTMSMENSSVLSCDKETNPVLTKDIPAATGKEHSNATIKNVESNHLVTRIKTGNAESTAVVVDRNKNLAICQDNRPVVFNSLKTSAEENKENMNVMGNKLVEKGTGTDKTEGSSEGCSQDDGGPPKPSVEVECLKMPQRQDLHSDSDEEDFLMKLPELELLEHGGTVFQPATGALLTASDAFFPFRCWGPTSHLATIGEDEEEDVTNQG